MDLIQRDARSVWHPFTQVQLADAPLALKSASGSWLYTHDGRKLLDATASWWVNAHGHAHPHIAAAIARQAETLEHIIFAGFTHEPAIRLAERLLALLPGNQEKIFFSDNGSTSVEVALKLAIQYFYNQGVSRQRIIAFRNAYHGDTMGGMSVAERNAFNLPFAPFLFEPHFIQAPEPGMEAMAIAELHAALSAGDTAAFIFEPLVQGAAGMRMHDAATLSEMIGICRAAGTITIADEVFTGFFRTGNWFASAVLMNQPDIICLSKALTGGFLPLAVTAVPGFLFEAFRSTDKYKTFFHGHSYTANPLACAAANASLDLFEADDFKFSVAMISEMMADFALKFAGHPRLAEIRQQGCILALELKSNQPAGYMNDDAAAIGRWFLNRGIYVRPLGNVLYITPPYCIEKAEMKQLLLAIEDYLNA
jgi:adenosylmethionine-8-amino-7-oxononanoate aminotransferase